MKKLEKGELAFLPSESTLIQFNKKPSSVSSSAVKKFITVAEPAHVLIVDQREPYYRVLYKGEYWLARKLDIYPMEALA